MSNARIRKNEVTATILSGAATTAAIDLGEHCPAGLLLPITTGTVYSFTVSMDDVTYYPLLDTAGTAITVTKVAGTASAAALNANDFAGWNYMKIIADSGNEGADRTISIVTYMV